MVGIGVLCVAFCFLYTTHLSYLGLGDLLVLVFFGIVPVCATYYIQTGTVTLQVLTASLACGLVVDTLLVVNNYRDRYNDRRTGKVTLSSGSGKRPQRYFSWVWDCWHASWGVSIFSKAGHGLSSCPSSI